MTCCRPFFFSPFFVLFLFALLLPSPRALLCRHLLPLRVVFVRKTAVSYLVRVVLSVQQELPRSYHVRVVLHVQQVVSVPLQPVHGMMMVFLWHLSAAFVSRPYRSCITSFRTPVVGFALFVRLLVCLFVCLFVFLFLHLFCFCFFSSLFDGLVCFVVFSYPAHYNSTSFTCFTLMNCDCWVYSVSQSSVTT